MRALLIPVGGEMYAVELTAVREVVPAPEPTPAPGGPAPLRGLFNLRGTILPLLDTAMLLGLPAAEPRYAVVADTADGPAALTATALPRTTALEDLAGPAELPGAIARFATGDGDVATLLDLNELVERLRA